MTAINFTNLSLSQAACIERALQQWLKIQGFAQNAVTATPPERADATQEINLVKSILYRDSRTEVQVASQHHDG